MDTKEKILKSALNRFVKEGFSATTASITKDAGVSAGILFHYFPTKNDLIIDLYAKILLEYHQVSVRVLKNFPRDNLEEFRANIRLSRDSVINWGLDNWQKFQYLQFFEGSLLADQFKLDENKEIEKLDLEFTEIIRMGIEYHYLKDLPVMFHLEASRAAFTFTIKYLHENPQYRYDENFIETAWQIHWNIGAR